MCFSAEASFTVGSVLVLTGVLCLRAVKNPKLLGLASIPLLFGLQQYCEGIVWLQLTGAIAVPWLYELAKMIFLVMAWIVWPVFVPLCLYFPEKESWRKKVCLAAFCVGLMIFLVDLRFLLFEEVETAIKGHSIYYSDAPMYGTIFYGISTVLPFFISSIRYLWIFGLYLLAAFVLSSWIAHTLFTSVFCFFAAAASVILLKLLKTEAQ